MKQIAEFNAVPVLTSDPTPIARRTTSGVVPAQKGEIHLRDFVQWDGFDDLPLAKLLKAVRFELDRLTAMEYGVATDEAMDRLHGYDLVFVEWTEHHLRQRITAAIVTHIESVFHLAEAQRLDSAVGPSTRSDQ